MAAAYSSKIMGIPATIVIPKSTPSFMIAKLRQENADVIVSRCCKVIILCINSTFPLKCKMLALNKIKKTKKI